MRIRLSTVIVVAALVAPLAAQVARRDGKWEVKMEMDMEGMPPGAMPPMTTTQCITPEQARDPKNTVPQGGGGRAMRGPDPTCKMADYKTVGNKVTWSMKCDGPPPIVSNGEIVYATDSYVGNMQMDRGGRVVKMKYTGKRLGDCDEKK